MRIRLTRRVCFALEMVRAVLEHKYAGLPNIWTQLDIEEPSFEDDGALDLQFTLYSGDPNGTPVEVSASCTINLSPTDRNSRVAVLGQEFVRPGRPCAGTVEIRFPQQANVPRGFICHLDRDGIVVSEV